MRGFSAAILALIPVCAAAAPAETVLHSFAALPRSGQTGARDGSNPVGGLVLSDSGTLTGTSESGGTTCGSNGPGCGAVFVLTPPVAGKTRYTDAVIARFNDTATGGYPMGSLVTGIGGVLYGTTANGGIGPSGAGNGTIFQLTPPAAGAKAWARKTLYEFAGGTDGANPHGRLLVGAGGALFGTTANGGAASDGTVFMLAPPSASHKTWLKTTLYAFSGGDGAKPEGGLTQLANGVLVGTATGGIPGVYGVVFGLTPPATSAALWTEATLYAFANYPTGVFPSPGDLIADTHGVIYGTTSQGGQGGAGTVFQLAPPAAGQSA